MRLRVALVTITARHLLALDDAGRIRTRSDRARTAMLGVAVRVRSAAKAPALHNALEAATLRGARDLDRIARRKDRDVDHVADVVGRDLGILARRVVDAERLERVRRCVEACLLRMTDLSLVRATAARSALVLLRIARNALRAET